MHRHAAVTDNREQPSEPKTPLPPRATGIFLGVWVAVLLFAAFFVVPELFAGCIPQTQ